MSCWRRRFFFFLFCASNSSGDNVALGALVVTAGANVVLVVFVFNVVSSVLLFGAGVDEPAAPVKLLAFIVVIVVVGVVIVVVRFESAVCVVSILGNAVVDVPCSNVVVFDIPICTPIIQDKNAKIHIKMGPTRKSRFSI